MIFLLGQEGVIARQIDEVVLAVRDMMMAAITFKRDEVTPDDIEDMMKEFKTDHLRKKFFSSSCGFVKPKCWQMGVRDEVQPADTGEPVHVARPLKFYSIDLRASLEAVLSLPNVKNWIMAASSMRHDGELISSPLHGKKFERVQDAFAKFSPGVVPLPLALYYDDSTAGNGLSPKSSSYSIGYFYVAMLSLPSHALQQRKYKILFATAHASDLKAYYFEPVVECLKQEMTDFTMRPLTISYNGVETVVMPFLFSVLGDNKGIHELMCLAATFSSGSICRACTVQYKDMCTVLSSTDTELKTPEWYDSVVAHGESLKHGILRVSMLNDVPFYHIADNHVFDLMHDVLEGEGRRQIARVVRHLMSRGKTLEELNNHVRQFSYGEHAKRSGIPNTFPEAVKKKGSHSIGQRAAQTNVLVQLLPVIFGTFADSTPEWRLFVDFSRLVSHLFRTSFSRSAVEDLRERIKSFLANLNEVYGESVGDGEPEAKKKKKKWNSPFCPKTHYLLHYPDSILEVGPPIHLWCMSFEQMHATAKRASYTSRNFINVPLTMANHCQEILTFERGKSSPDLTVSKTDTISLSRNEDAPRIYRTAIRAKFPDAPDRIRAALKANCRGTDYYEADCVVWGCDNENEPLFGFVALMVEVKDIWYFVIHKLRTVEYSEHDNTYIVTATKEIDIVPIEENNLNTIAPLDFYPAPSHDDHHRKVALRSRPNYK